MSDTGVRRWVVAGGGTGGHVTPALALAERITARGDAVLVLGAERGLEARLVPEAGFELVTLPARQLMGRRLVDRLRALPAMGAACGAAWRVLGRRGAEIVVSVGGYASVPAVVAAALRRLPLALLEPNAVPGRANRAAARFARRIFVQFDAAAEVFAGSVGRERVRSTGIPLRSALIEAFGDAAPRRRPAPPFRLLVFGGSQGARQINQAMIEAAAGLDPDLLEIFHQAGEADRQPLAAAYAAAGLRAEVVAFEPDMPSRYRWADLALCRSGALTVAELALAGLPALLVPYPHAADDHQLANAKALDDAGAARVLAARPLAPQEVAGAIRAAFERPAELQAMGARAAGLARPDAAERIVEECAALIAGGRENA
jgi:UDP-N-acetylglucosamine--N-acetylmuramyl-(pentapeptide) pyrophosphoryl-undecaprenol N-acetylglucosamine transferase